MAVPRVLLDTNVWNYLVDVNGVEPLRKAAKAHQVAVIACPAVVYECLRVGDRDVRSRRAKALAREDWTRLMPEAFSEAQDLRKEVERLRPNWVLDSPDLRQWQRNRADWQGGFWWRVRKAPDVVARHISVLGDAQLQQARKETVAARRQAASYAHTIHTFKWNRATTSFTGPTPGWNGQEFEAWRGASVSTWWRDLVLGQSQTALDWLAPWLDLQAIAAEPASWTRFWTHDAESVALPREWIRWAMAEAQATRATSPGTPGDNQLATYLVDVDLFVSTDKVFVELVDAMRPHCPAPLAATRRSPAGGESLEFLLELLAELS